MKYYLAIDIGASSGRHILAHLEKDKIVMEEIYRFKNLPDEKPDEFDGGNLHLFWDTERLYNEIITGLKIAGDMGKAPYSIGIDTWGVDYALMDENDKLIGGVYCYRDARTVSALKKVHAIIPESSLYKKTGIQIESFNTVYQLYCDKESGKLNKAASFLPLPNYLNFLLTGVKKQEYTIATTSGLVNAEKRIWDESIIQKLNFKNDLFCEISMPGTIVGEFSEKVANLVGYKATVVLPATHDTASAVLAAPIKEGDPYISSGTWSLLGVEEKNSHTDESAFAANYSNEGSINGYRLQKNIVGLWMIQKVRAEAEKQYTFEELAELARKSPTEYVIPVDDPRFLAPKNMTEEICTVIGKKLSLGELAYTVCNSLALTYKEALSDLEKITGVKYQTLNIIGGGSQNTLLNELTAKHTGKRIITGPTECTAIGNVMMQMISAGDIADVENGRQIVKNSFEIKEF